MCLRPPLFFCTFGEMFTHIRNINVRQSLSDAGLAQRMTKIPIEYKEGDTRVYTQIIMSQMRKIANDYVNDPGMKKLAADLERGDDMKTLQADFDFLKNAIEYVDDDPAYAEVIRSPIQTIFNSTGGDCDDMAVAAACLCKIQGFNVSFRALQWRVQQYTHVYCVVNGVNFDLVQSNLGEQYVAEPGIQLRYMDMKV